MSNVQKNSNWTGSVLIYIKKNEDWMTESEQPLVTGLLQIAKALDEETRLSASKVTEFRQMIAELHKRKPITNAKLKQELETIDSLDEFLETF